LRIECHCGGGSLKSQMKRADKSGARYAVLFGEPECVVKDLRGSEVQRSLGPALLRDYLRNQFS
jgi:histidyl-tRNA synthetase